jgi:hypothetical protein
MQEVFSFGFTKEKRSALVKEEIKSLFKKLYATPLKSEFYYAKAQKGTQFHLVNRATHKAICKTGVKPSHIEAQLIDIPENKLCKQCLKQYHKGR